MVRIKRMVFLRVANIFRKQIAFVSFLLLCSLFVASGVSAEWYNHVSEDRMTGEKSCYAISPRIDPDTRMAFPYNDTQAWIGVGYNGKNQWAYFGFSNSPNLTNTSIGNGYNTIRTRIKWDEQLENITLIQEWGARSIHVRSIDVDDAVDKLAESNAVLLELSWHGSGRVYFEFPLKGSAAVIDQMRRECGG